MQLLPLYKAKKVTFFMVGKKYLVIFANIIFFDSYSCAAYFFGQCIRMTYFKLIKIV